MNEIKYIAEIGGNHQGDFKKAVDYIDLAYDAGLSTVKFQIYCGETLVNKKIDPSRVEHFNKFSFSIDEYIKLASYTRKLGLEFAASIWDINLIRVFSPYLNFYKIGSGDLTSYKLIEETCKQQKPIILSTGLSKLCEIEKTVDFIYSISKFHQKKENLVIMQCTSMYPIPDNEANLNVISTLKKTFNVTVGYSDHTIGIDALALSTVLGAEVLEFHFTDNKENLTFRDHQVSLEPNDVVNLRDKVKSYSQLTGDYEKYPTKAEVESDHVYSFRRAIYPNKIIKKNEILSDDNLICLRPMKGLCASNYPDVIGKRTKKSLSPLEEISLDNIY